MSLLGQTDQLQHQTQRVLHLNTTPSGEVALFNAEQSSTLCYSDGTCLSASRAIDGDWKTYSNTAHATGTHWLQVSMTNTLVYQIVLRASTKYSEEITVSLYSGETLAGQCKSHTGTSRSTETLSCAKVTADRVRLTVSGTSSTYLAVYEITVLRVPTMTIGLYMLSARIVSVSRQLVCIWYQPEL